MSPPGARNDSKDLASLGSADLQVHFPDAVKGLEGNDADIDTLLHRNNAEIRDYPDFTPGANESYRHYAYRLLTEGHTTFDAWLLGAGCIGQVMMTTPNAWSKMGLVPGALMIALGTLLGFYTIWQLKAMYYDRKRDYIQEGVWFDDPKRPYKRLHKTQLQELLGYFLTPGSRLGVNIVAAMIATYWFGVCVAQILASATDFYAINKTYNLRTLVLIFGATLMPFGYIPSFRKMRVILIIGVVGTLTTAVYGIYAAFTKGFAELPHAAVWPKRQTNGPPFAAFFNGVAVLFAILDHHNIFPETIEAMQHPRRYAKSYALSFFPLFFMIVPPGILLNLAFAKSGVQTAGNWFNITPPGTFRTVAAWLMILHNIQAFVLWVTAFGFMFEKWTGVHEKPLWVRNAVRTPLLLAIWCFAAAFPFYETINSLMKGLATPLLMYTVPALAFLLHYRHPANREACVYPMAKWMFAKVGWTRIFWLNVALCTYGTILMAFTSTMAVFTLAQKSYTFGLFPACYGCAAA